MSLRTNTLRLTAVACASTLFGFDQQVQALCIEDMLSNSFTYGLSQVDSQISSQQELIDGMLAAAQDGVIRIPIQKQETGYLSQIYAQLNAGSTTASGVNEMDNIPGTQFPQTFNM